MRPDPMIDSAFGSAEGPGVVPETILPEQFFRPSAALPPEKRLMLAVLEGALLDLQRSAGPSTPRARRLADEVDAWFAADDEGWPCSFLGGRRRGRTSSRSGSSVPMPTTARWTRSGVSRPLASGGSDA